MRIRDGFIPELALHQKKVQKMTEISRCSVVKYVRPLQGGFQCLHHCFLEDTIITPIGEKRQLPDDGVNSPSLEELKNSMDKYQDDLVQLGIECSFADIQKLPTKLSQKLNPNILEDPLALVRRRVSVPVEMFIEMHRDFPDIASKIRNWTLVKRAEQQKEYIAEQSYFMKLRRVPTKQRDQIAPAVAATESDGFLNYFAPSVFGKLIKRGYIFGSHIYHQEYRAILHMLLHGKNVDSLSSDDECSLPYEQETSIRQLESHTTVSSIELDKLTLGAKKLMRSMTGKALNRLEECSEKDVEKLLLGALDQRTLLKWVRELCCMIWNKAVSRRIATYGAFHILPGDIVLENAEYVFITSDDVKSNKYSPSDILMPIPGPHVSLPHNECALIYESIFAEFRLPKDMEKWTIPLLSHGFSGAYRPMIVRPTQMKHRITTDTDCHSVELSFRLPYGSFASMCVREIVKLEMNTPAECGVDVSVGGDKGDAKRKSSVDVPLAEVKPRHFSEEQKRQYQKKHDPGRKKFTPSRALHKARLLNVIYRRILPQGTERWRKLSVNGRI